MNVANVMRSHWRSRPDIPLRSREDNSIFVLVVFGMVVLAAGIVVVCILLTSPGHDRAATHRLASSQKPKSLRYHVKGPAAPAANDLAEQSHGEKSRAERNLTPKPEAPGLAYAAPETVPETLLTLGDPTIRLGLDLSGLREAISFYKAGELEKGDQASRAGKDKIVRTTLEWIALRSLPREAGFERLQAFAAAHPSWPAAAWLRRRAEEALFFDPHNAELVAGFFAARAPDTPAGKLALARILGKQGKKTEAAALVRTVWREADFTLAFEAKLKTDFGVYLDKADHKYRADRLLYKEHIGAALRAAALAGPDVLALAKARAAVINEEASDKLLAAVPQTLHDDPGFLFAKIQKLRRAGKLRDAVALMSVAPRHSTALVNGDEWWIERRLLARKLLDERDGSAAYKLCAEHSAQTNEMQVEAEFHAGWIALRFLKQAPLAAKHFANLAALARTPMSSARAAYWQARAAEAESDNEAENTSKPFYEKAAAQVSTFYGQLARAHLGLQTIPVRALENAAKGNERDESIRIIEFLYAIGERDLAKTLVLEAAQSLAAKTQIAALANIVARQGEAHLSLLVGKILSQRGLPHDALAFPTYGIPHFEPLQNSADKSVVYAVARQESAFEPKVVSSAGAKGLMQMITSTARRTAQQLGVTFNDARLLADSAFNAQLGAAHLGALLNEQGGSFILTFAAYNAGGKRVREWIDAYGDPRRPEVDPVDWIERIPFTETRNYVQRVLENLTVYKARFNESALVSSNAGVNRKTN